MDDRKKYAEEIAGQIISVQPMPSDTFAKLMEGAKSPQWLRENGYRPVSRLGLMWIKDEPQEDSHDEAHHP